jgi:hypothetical protein
MNTLKFKQKCLDYNRTEASWLFDELWDEIQAIDDIEDAKDIYGYIPSGMLMYRFLEKFPTLRKYSN